MSILEICQLRIKETIAPTDPRILQSLQTVRSSLAAKIHNTNSRFYKSLEDPTLIYILGVWPSLSTHHSFLSSPAKQDILAPQQDLLDFISMLHIPLESMASLPLQAPVMSIARLHVKDGESVGEFERIAEKYRPRVEEASKPYVVVEGWRVDADEGKREAVVISGWERKEDHERFTRRACEDEEYARMRTSLCEGIEARHVIDLEGLEIQGGLGGRRALDHDGRSRQPIKKEEVKTLIDRGISIRLDSDA